MRQTVAIASATVLAALLALGSSREASAHGGQPTVAWVNDPIGVGNVVDQSFTFTWLDFDKPVATGTATVDFYYIATRPPTFSAGTIPDPLDGTPIVTGILEKDLANAHTWDTSAVPAGSYLIWSRVNEPPSEVFSPLIISYSPGVLTVAHPGDPVHPAVMITTPDTPFRFADPEFEVRYAAFDPDGTGKVKLEAGTTLDGTNFITLAEDLPAVADGAYHWDTSQLAEADWTLRATITDERGLSFTHYGRYFLLVTHLGPRPDASVVDASPQNDGSIIPTYDGGVEEPAPKKPAEGCACSASDHRPAAAKALPLVLALLFIRRRQR